MRLWFFFYIWQETIQNLFRYIYYTIHYLSRYNLLYQNLFGGAVAIFGRHFQEINGFSNSFYGWGGEDDDFLMRLGDKGLTFVRFDPVVARYVMLPHRKENPSPIRWWKLANHRPVNTVADGLSSLQYKVDRIEMNKFSTHIYVY